MVTANWGLGCEKEEEEEEEEGFNRWSSHILTELHVLTGLGTFVFRLSKKALAAAQSCSALLSAAAAGPSGLISLILQSFRVSKPSTEKHFKRLGKPATAEKELGTAGGAS